MCVHSGTPIANLPLLTKYLENVTDWENFGLYLLPPDTSATEIEMISRDHPKDVKECKRKLLNIYWQQGTRTWEKVVEALEEAKYPHIAQEIRTAEICSRKTV